MSAPQIPNLNTLRRGVGGRGRGSGRPLRSGHRPGIENEELSAQLNDSTIQLTDDDAALSRMSAVSLGYLDDPYAKYFMAGYFHRRFPIINRGTYVRTTIIDALVEKFVGEETGEKEQKKQIISLGAGTDTRFFRLRRKMPQANLVYHELDFPENTKKKITIVKETPELLSAIASPTSSSLLDVSDDIVISADNTSFYSATLNIHPIDLRTLNPNLLNSKQILTSHGVDTSLPTLLISECCLIYLSTASADSVLQYFSRLFPSTTPLALILYEPIKPFDAFGRIMESNLLVRGIVLPTLQKYSSLAAQRERLKEHGFDGGQCASDMDFLWEQWVCEEEKQKVKQLELMDEIEEWLMLARHYCVAWGWRAGVDGDSPFDCWKALKTQE